MLLAAIAVSALYQAPLDLAAFEQLIQADRPAAVQSLRRRFAPEDLAKGIGPIDQGLRVLFAVDTGPGSHNVTVESRGRVIATLERWGGDLYGALSVFGEGDAFPAEYRVDGKVLRGGLQIEVYDPNPFVLAPPGGRKGVLRDMGEWKSTIFPDTTRKWYVYLPPNLDSAREYPVLICTDAQWDRDWIANGLENCAREGLIPPTVGVFVEPGQDRPGNYKNRSFEYDRLTPAYSDFLLKEILPPLAKLVKLSQDPANRALLGVSSGGICAFTACWERPDQFGVAISLVGSFANIASGESKREGGHNYPFLIRKSDKKPIRAFLQDGENDLDNEHGSWWVCNLQMVSALRFKGYDVVWVPGKGFHNTKQGRRVFDKILTWWQNGPSK